MTGDVASGGWSQANPSCPCCNPAGVPAVAHSLLSGLCLHTLTTDYSRRVGSDFKTFFFFTFFGATSKALEENGSH